MMHQELLRHFWIFGRDQVYCAEDPNGAYGHVVGMSNGDCDYVKRSAPMWMADRSHCRASVLLTLFGWHRYNSMLILSRRGL